MPLMTVGAGLAVGGMVGGMFSGRRARRAQRRAQAVERRIRDSQIRRERQAQLRQAQQARAGAEAMSAISGTMDSSGYAGVRSAIGSTVAGNLALSGDMAAGANLMQAHGDRAARHQSRAQTFGAISQLGMGMMSMGQAGMFGSGAAVPTAQPGGMQMGALAGVQGGLGG